MASTVTVTSPDTLTLTERAQLMSNFLSFLKDPTGDAYNPIQHHPNTSLDSDAETSFATEAKTRREFHFGASEVTEHDNDYAWSTATYSFSCFYNTSTKEFTLARIFTVHGNGCSTCDDCGRHYATLDIEERSLQDCVESLRENDPLRFGDYDGAHVQTSLDSIRDILLTAEFE
jgi:hypothetical protein